MLLPDNIHPELSIYYNGALVIKELQKKDQQSIINLYEEVRTVNDMSFPTFVMCLDWLYLIQLAQVDEKGVVKLCS